MKGKIAKGIKRRREKAIIEKEEYITQIRLQSLLGTEQEVLCDGVDFEKSCFTGRAYFQAPEIDGAVFFTAEHAEEGKVCRVKIERADAYDLYGCRTDC